MEKLLAVMRKLRSEEGCPWDREQTLETLKPFLIEEAYEVLDAIDSGEPSALKEELGDVLLQVVFQAQLCEESDWFRFEDVVNTIRSKLIRRHPHVFGDVQVEDSAEVLRNWNAIKRNEDKNGAGKSVVGKIPRHMPALQKADQVQRRASQVGFDWTEVHDVLAKIDEELHEVREALAAADKDALREELGDLLFSVVNLSRFMGHSAEEALEETVNKFIRRFQDLEDQVHQTGKNIQDYTLEELDTFWEKAKTKEQQARK